MLNLPCYCLFIDCTPLFPLLFQLEPDWQACRGVVLVVILVVGIDGLNLLNMTAVEPLNLIPIVDLPPLLPDLWAFTFATGGWYCVGETLWTLPVTAIDQLLYCHLPLFNYLMTDWPNTDNCFPSGFWLTCDLTTRITSWPWDVVPQWDGPCLHDPILPPLTYHCSHLTFKPLPHSLYCATTFPGGKFRPYPSWFYSDLTLIPQLLGTGPWHWLLLLIPRHYIELRWLLHERCWRTNLVYPVLTLLTQANYPVVEPDPRGLLPPVRTLPLFIIWPDSWYSTPVLCRATFIDRPGTSPPQPPYPSPHCLVTPVTWHYNPCWPVDLLHWTWPTLTGWAPPPDYSWAGRQYSSYSHYCDDDVRPADDDWRYL